MAPPLAGSILRPLRQAVLRHDGSGLSDGQLLRSFLQDREEAAFAALVRRHGPMVRGVCHRILRNSHDADDAFQAAFLVLFRKATDLAGREVVGDWLHGVAYRTALKARAAAARRRVKEQQVPPRAAMSDGDRAEWLALLDREIDRLPEKYRLPVVLCDLQGRTRKEAARQLGWPEGTISGRLSRARVLLARRLTRRGVTLSATALAAALLREASAGLPASLTSSPFRTGIIFSNGQAAAGSVNAAALAKGVVKAMLLSKFKTTALLLSSALVVAVGIGVWRHAATAGQAEERQSEKLTPVAPNVFRADEKAVPIPPAKRQFLIHLRLVQVKDGKRKELAAPELITLDGGEVQCALGDEYVFSWGGGKVERVVLGPSVRLLVHSEKDNQVRIALTAAHSSRASGAVEDATVETQSARVIRKVELDQPITLKLKTNEKEPSLFEVTAAVTVADPSAIEAIEKMFRMAEFYRKKGHADSACFYYERICQRYRGTLYAEKAAEQLLALRPPYSKADILPNPNQEKPQARVGQIILHGNKKITPEVIVKQIQLFPGAILKDPEIRAIERNLSRLKGIKSVKIRLNGEKDSVYKDIVISIEEE